MCTRPLCACACASPPGVDELLQAVILPMARRAAGADDLAKNLTQLLPRPAADGRGQGAEGCERRAQQSQLEQPRVSLSQVSAQVFRQTRLIGEILVTPFERSRMGKALQTRKRCVHRPGSLNQDSKA